MNLRRARAWIVIVGLVMAACSREAAPPPPDPFATQVRLEVRFKRHELVPSLILDLGVTHIGRAPIRDVRIECVQTTLSGARLDARELTLAGPIAPQASAERTDFDSGFLRLSESLVRCRVQALDSVVGAAA